MRGSASETRLEAMAVAEQNLQEQLDAHRQRVDVDHFDLTVRELMRMAGEGELKRAPVYQRKFRWSEETESRLVESVLLGLPVPSIFVATNPDGSWEVVDGLQRLSTLIHFSDASPEQLVSINKSEPLQLRGLTDLTRFNGYTFDDLPAPVQLAFFKRALRVTALSDKSNRETRFELFERLNAGGLPSVHRRSARRSFAVGSTICCANLRTQSRSKHS